jgi:hypothetical protein
MTIPIILVNGAYHVSATGASPRYVLPLIPLVCILAAEALNHLSRKMNRFWTMLILIILAVWILFFTYPLPQLFKLSPKIAFAAHYAPVYQLFPYKNYPNHINALTKWVEANTPENSVIFVTSAQPYHFYYYAKRKVVTFPNVKSEVVRKIYKQKMPIFIVEDHEATYNPDMINTVKEIVGKLGLKYKIVGKVPLFSPRIGETIMHIYRVL